TCVNYDIDFTAFERIRKLTLGQFKNLCLESPGETIAPLGFGLTGVMAAAVTKLCDTHELIYIAKKIARPSKARTHLGLPGTLSARLQPNHPTDDLKSIEFLIYAGLSMGSGDALIGMNPAIDTVENIGAVLTHMDQIRRKTGAPTQVCALSHVKTQMECLKRGVPVEIIFQSLGGTEATNLTEFDFSVDTLDAAFALMQELGPIREAENFFYFETGQGSEFTYGKHDGTDMATLEANCYGLARRYRPFMVHNVTGFIGPETHADNFEMVYSSLQDHFMGKLLGVPMGMAPCYTLHSSITLEGQQMATEMLTAAGANYYMDVYLNTDRMLAYFDTSSHDNQTLREIYDKRPAPEFLTWAIGRGIYEMENGSPKRGPQWGKLEPFCDSPEHFQTLARSTASVHGFENAGPRPADGVSRDLRLHQGIARDATFSELDTSRLKFPFRVLNTTAGNKAAHLNSPSLGSRIHEESRKKFGKESAAVQVVLSDGLSAEAIHHNASDLVTVLYDGFKATNTTVGEAIIAPFGRVKLAEAISDVLEPQVIVMLIGERPGGDANASRSLSCYFLYRLSDEAKRAAAKWSGNPNVRFEYTVLSNIYAKGGIPPWEAGSLIVEKVGQILKHQAAGNRLEQLLQR
ncbi:MAG: ethanolamine ammonia-lyase, partial [Deltaproteobacteria bacterium]|nr:ethanolamine ammonia-lyase [Deltaproteobacteria bacterium]